MMPHAPCSAAICISLLLTAATSAIAAPPASQPASQPDLLAGPSVENSATTEASRMGPGGVGGQKPGDQRNKAIPMQRWVRVLRTIDLAPEQDSAIKSIIEDWNTTRNTWFSAHSDEIKSLRDQYNTSRETGKPDRALADEIQSLQSSAPKLEDYQQKIWNELTSDQQSLLREKLKAPQKSDRRPNNRTNAADNDDAMSPQDADTMSGSLMSDTDNPMTPAGMENSTPSPTSSTRDAAADRRFNFLHNHQSASAPGAPPSPAERTFHFGDDS